MLSVYGKGAACPPGPIREIPGMIVPPYSPAVKLNTVMLYLEVIPLNIVRPTCICDTQYSKLQLGGHSNGDEFNFYFYCVVKRCPDNEY